jgi:hypothetical protein
MRRHRSRAACHEGVGDPREVRARVDRALEAQCREVPEDLDHAGAHRIARDRHDAPVGDLEDRPETRAERGAAEPRARGVGAERAKDSLHATHRRHERGERGERGLEASGPIERAPRDELGRLRVDRAVHAREHTVQAALPARSVGLGRTDLRALGDQRLAQLARVAMGRELLLGPSHVARQRPWCDPAERDELAEELERAPAELAREPAIGRIDEGSRALEHRAHGREVVALDRERDVARHGRRRLQRVVHIGARLGRRAPLGGRLARRRCAHGVERGQGRRRHGAEADLREHVGEHVRLGLHDRELPPLARLVLLREERVELVGPRACDHERQAQRREVAPLGDERAVASSTRLVEHDDRAEQLREAHRRAGGHVAGRDERWVGALELACALLVGGDQIGHLRAEPARHHDLARERLQRVDVLDREARGERRARLDRRAHDGAEVIGVREGARHERDERDAVDEREQRAPVLLEDLGEVAVRRHQRALDRAARDAVPLLELALLEEVERRAQQHVAAVEHLVEERMHRAEQALVGEVHGASRVDERAEVHGADELRLHGALGDLPREDARRARRLVEDAAHHRRRELALGRARRARHEHVLLRDQRERDLRERIAPLDEARLELVEEGREVSERRLGPRLGSHHGRNATTRLALPRHPRKACEPRRRSV